MSGNKKTLAYASELLAEATQRGERSRGGAKARSRAAGQG